jgi:hypothetical protein
MRIVTKKFKHAGPALAVAALGVCVGVPAAHAGFNVTVLGPYTDTANPTYQIYVATALDNGALTTPSNNTGSLLTALDVVVTTNGSVDLGMDVEQHPTGTYRADVDGQDNSSPSFGTSSGGTFIGIGQDNLSAAAGGANQPDAGFDPTMTTSSWTTVGGTQDTYVNAQVGAAAPVAAKISGNLTATGLDPAFKNGTTVNQSAINNGSVTALEVVENGNAGNGAVEADQFAVPFANVVVPKGTTGTISGLLGGDVGLNAPFSVSFGTTVTSVQTTLSLTSAAPSSSNEIGTGITMSGHNGSYVPQSVSVSGAAQTKGYLEVSGFTATDPEIYALTATPGTANGGETLAALIAELNTDVALADAGATAVAITPTIAHLFPTADIEVDIPGGDGSNPAFLAYDLTEDTTGPSITAIGVVPEPTSIGFLVLGGIGLLARRRRAMQA